MADQRTVGNAGQSPAEAGAQVRDRVQEAGAQVRDRAQAMVRQKEETASDDYQRGRRQVEALQNTFADTMRAKPWQSYYRQGRQQVEDAEHTLEDTVRARPLQALLMAAGVGMFLGVLMKK
jgi:ElaB/YqjD/DUF883 family membrane-anchored ribosome-binding protein